VTCLYVTSVGQVEEFALERDGVKGVRVKYLLHAGVGAKNLQLRLFTIDVGGYTPIEKHEHEHEIFVLKGKGIIRGGDVEVEVKPGDVVFIPSNEDHQIRNIGDCEFQFLCTKQTSELPKELKSGK